MNNVVTGTRYGVQKRNWPCESEVVWARFVARGRALVVVGGAAKPRDGDKAAVQPPIQPVVALLAGASRLPIRSHVARRTSER